MLKEQSARIRWFKSNFYRLWYNNIRKVNPIGDGNSFEKSRALNSLKGSTPLPSAERDNHSVKVTPGSKEHFREEGINVFICQNVSGVSSSDDSKSHWHSLSMGMSGFVNNLSQYVQGVVFLRTL